MSVVKLTKHGLRSEEVKLVQLQRYLPTLQLKKALLQSEVGLVRLEIQKLTEAFDYARLQLSSVASLFSERIGLNIEELAQVKDIKTRIENVAGVDVPIYEAIHFVPVEYSLFSTPSWVDSAMLLLHKMLEARARVHVAEEKKAALEKELRDVTIRVNLFEKNLIPKAQSNIRKIKVFLGDQQLASVGQAKVAKIKISKRKGTIRAS